MRKIKFRFIIIFLIALSTAIAGVFLPGMLMEYRERMEIASIEKVSPGSYSTSQEAITQMASANLSNDEKLRLINGEWKSRTKTIDESSMTLDSYKAVQLAKEGISVLYRAGKITVDLEVEYGNWYYWETECREAVDTTFGTYAAKYWIIHFYRYDGEQELTVKMLEDGTVFDYSEGSGTKSEK